MGKRNLQPTRCELSSEERGPRMEDSLRKLSRYKGTQQKKEWERFGDDTEGKGH